MSLDLNHDLLENFPYRGCRFLENRIDQQLTFYCEVIRIWRGLERKIWHTKVRKTGAYFFIVL